MQERGTGSGARGGVWAIVGALPADRLEGGYYRRHYLDVDHAGQSSVRWAINDYAVSGHPMFGVRNRSA